MSAKVTNIVKKIVLGCEQLITILYIFDVLSMDSLKIKNIYKQELQRRIHWSRLNDGRLCISCQHSSVITLFKSTT